MQSYNILSKLGTGTFGTVYLCEKKHNKVKIVVKEIDAEVKNEQIEAAKNEVTILRSLDHPNVIQYYENFTLNKKFYIIMEYANKGNLYEYIYKHKPNHLEQEVILNLFCQILRGLHYIHNKNIIHRDLKCENIFLTGLNGDVVKIGDFGISKSLKGDAKAHTFIGTANYVAPEICDGQMYDMKSDVWSLGCILFELCAMERMFDGTVANIIRSITNGKKKQINMDLYEKGIDLQYLLDNMLQQNPEERPTTSVILKFPIVLSTYYMQSTELGCIKF